MSVSIGHFSVVLSQLVDPRRSIVEMALQDTLRLQPLFSSVIEKRIGDFPFFAGTCPHWRKRKNNTIISSSSMKCRGLSSPNFFKLRSLPATGFGRSGLRASKLEQILKSASGNEEGGGESSGSDVEDDPLIMDEDERKEWRRKIREVIDMNPDVEEEVDAIERRKRMEKLLADYPLVVEEDDPDWPEDADGWGFNLDQFFNKITIKNAKKDDDENYDSENELVWQDDDYIRPIKEINTKEWEETVFKDISPLILLVHNRYKRPKLNEKIRDELEKAVQIIWNCRLPSPRCVAIDAVVELDVATALHVSVFPELIFTKAGKILYREKAIRTADELSKMMAFFYYGAAKPPCLNNIGYSEELIPMVPVNSEHC